MTKKAYTLIEILIVVSILGIIAAIVVPQYQNNTQQAREANAKQNIRILRTAIERYKADHGVPPCYHKDGSIDEAPIFFTGSLTNISNQTGTIRLEKVPRDEFIYGPYLKEIPKNPITGNSGIHIDKTLPFPEPGTSGAGWVYHPPTGEIRLDAAGTDSQGTAYSDY
jgi:general secretion pathway protein G